MDKKSRKILDILGKNKLLWLNYLLENFRNACKASSAYEFQKI